MKAKDATYSRSATKRLQAQAPIPFEAGRMAGIREVVDFMREIGVIGFGFDVCTEEEEKEQRLKWSLQLKNWGL